MWGLRLRKGCSRIVGKSACFVYRIDKQFEVWGCHKFSDSGVPACGPYLRVCACVYVMSAETCGVVERHVRPPLGHRQASGSLIN